MKLSLISHALCPYVQRAVIALKEKQVAYERIDIDLNAKPDWFLAISPLGKTPVLLAGNQPVFESAVICEYLEDTTSHPLHPRDPLMRARHRAWIEFSSATLNSIWAFYTAQDDVVYEAAAKLLKERFAHVERVLIERERNDALYFAGPSFSLVDAAFGPVFRYFDVFDEVSDIDFFAAMPKINAWRKALAQRTSIQTAVSADYRSLLQDFVIRQKGVLGKRLTAAINADVRSGKSAIVG